MRKEKLKVAVLMGGPSAEYEVSLNTGKQVLENLDKKKYLAQPLVVTKTGKWLLPEKSPGLLTTGAAKKTFAFQETAALKKVKENRPDVIFIAMHGVYGEDGTVQGLLETTGIPYTGSGVLASALGMDKPRSCAVFREAGLKVPDFEVIARKEIKNSELLRKIIKKIGWPAVVKPSNQGSSIGITIVKNRKKLLAALEEAAKYSGEVIIQKFIHGREMTCGVMEMTTAKKTKLLPLPPIEIIPKACDFYDYSSKYAKGGSDHLIPPRDISPKVIKKIQKAASIAHRVIGCSGMSRPDFILGEDGELYILEINTIPGMTKTSLLPQAARAQGIHFSKFLDIVIQNAL